MSMKYDLEPVIELIYDAVKQPNYWEDVVAQLVEISGSNSGILSVERADQSEILSSFSMGLEDSAMEQYANYYHKLDVWTRKLTRMPSAQFYSSHNFHSQKEYLNSESYTDWGRACHMDYALGARVESSSNMQVRVAVQRSEREGPYRPEENQQINRLFSHLRRAMDLSQHFAGKQLQQESAQQILDQFTVAAFAVEVDGRIRFQNLAAERLLRRDGVIKGANNRLQLETCDQARLSKMIRANVLAGQGAEQSYDTVLKVSSVSEQIELNVSPLVVTEPQFGHQSRKVLALVLIKPLNDVPANFSGQAKLYKLTARETRIAVRLCQGQSIEQIASEMQVKTSTIRSHLKNLFQKTQTNSQPQLVALLLGGLSPLLLSS